MDSMGSSGLALLWHDDIDLKILNYSTNHIHASITDHFNCTWIFTGIYRHPETHKRKDTWTLIKSLKPFDGMLWLLCSDFNEITYHSEKLGGHRRPGWKLSQFREVLDFCHLLDLRFTGSKFTWCNHREGKCRIFDRLDKYVVYPEW